MWIKRTEYENLIEYAEKYYNRVKELERAICGMGEGKTMYISRLNDGTAWGLFMPSETLAVYNDKFSKLNTENDGNEEYSITYPSTEFKLVMRRK